MSTVAIDNCPYVNRAIVEGPVGLVVAWAGSRANAMTVSFFSEVAHYPTSMWLSIARDTYTHSLLEENPEFSFITLSQRQADIAVTCGTVSGWRTDKRKALDLYDNRGFLFLRGAIASTACRLVRSVRLEDRTLWIAHLLHGDVERGRKAVRNLMVSDLRGYDTSCA
jgi:flavin reductase (DIM6/NTAB) family NADH-FMN oxidoreductase RutF